jgi:hypothetical protein
MAHFSIPAPFLGWGFLFLPAEPSILSTTRHLSRGHIRSRTGRVRSQLTRALLVGDPDVAISASGWAQGGEACRGCGLWV